MLLEFRVKNFKSIKDQVSFSLVASKERRHSDRLTAEPLIRGRILPFATIHGPNGSGKSTLVKAMVLAKKMVIHTPQIDESLEFSPFKLCSQNLMEPTCFGFRIAIDGTVCDYEFAYTSEEIVHESLSVVDLRKSHQKQKRVLFCREMGNVIDAANLSKLTSEQNDLAVIVRSTASNRLFLNVLYQNAQNQKDTYSWANLIISIFDWLRRDLLILQPQENIPLSNPLLLDTVSQLISLFDTGVNKVRLLEVKKELLNLPKGLLAGLEANIAEGAILPFPVKKNGGVVFVKKIGGEIRVYEVMSSHTSEEGEEVTFELDDESDGTKRLMTLLAVLAQLGGKKRAKTLIVDELDQSLHSSVVHKIVNDFLAIAGSENRSQLIMTTHDVTIMNGKSLRRDEMYITSRLSNGSTSLQSLSNVDSAKEKAIRFDLDLISNYLNGNLGGIARLSKENYLTKIIEN